MKIDFSAKLSIPGVPEEHQPTLGMACARALGAEPPPDQNGQRRPLSLDESVRRGNLALKVVNGGEHDLKSEDISLIKSVLPNVWTPLPVALAVRLLDPAA